EPGKRRHRLPTHDRHLPWKKLSIHQFGEVDARAVGEQGYGTEIWWEEVQLVPVERGVAYDPRRRVTPHDDQDRAQSDDERRCRRSSRVTSSPGRSSRTDRICSGWS